ncbi:MAG: nucleotidyltransferase family protein [Butyrivibrio sp.]|nr:nucleotidyltransferase family protein [Butyrivibrio sp.]
MAEFLTVREYLRELVCATLEKRDPEPVPKDISIRDLVDIGAKSQIQYLIYNSLIKVVNEQNEDYELIKQRLSYSIFKTFVQVMAASKIAETFEKNNIRFQILKGTIMKKIYPSPEMREMSDIDLVVYDENLDRAAEVLESMGFLNHGLKKHHMIFSKDKKLVVEVHWCLFDENVGQIQHMYFKDNFRARLKEGTGYTYEFSKEDFYVYMIAHMAKHFFETGCGIRNLIDIYIYLNKYEKEMNREYLISELKKCKIDEFEKNMRELSYVWLDNRPCSDFHEKLFAYMLDSGIYGKTENGIWGQLAKETTNDNSSFKLHYYFPSIKFMREKYKWLKRYPFLLPIAWVIRGVSGFSNKQSRDHAQNFENSGDAKIKEMLDIYHRLNLDFRK